MIFFAFFQITHNQRIYHCALADSKSDWQQKSPDEPGLVGVEGAYGRASVTPGQP